MREAPRRRRLDAVVAAFVVDCRARSLSPKTISSYLEASGSFRAFVAAAVGAGPLAGQTLADLTLESGRAWAADLKEGRRPATVANRIRGLKVLSNWCVTETYLATDPLARLHCPRIPRTIVVTFSEDQVRVMLQLASPALAMTLRILLDTGLRISEAVGLTCDDVLDGYLRVTGKALAGFEICAELPAER
jgi:integrase/recombinase XerD